MSAERPFFSARLHTLIPVLVVALGLVFAWFILKSDRQPSKAAPSLYQPLVEIVSLVRQDSRPLWRTSGLVIPSSETRLAFQVAGKVESVGGNSIPGQILPSGEALAQLDSADLALAVLQGQASLAQAQAKLALEQGQADLAQEEFRLSQSSTSSSQLELVLRKPQLAAAKADVAIAEAALQKAQINLQRATLTMPFTGQLLEKQISVGANVTPQTPAFTVVAVDEFWVEVKLPRQFLTWLDPQQPVQLSLPQWQGRQRSARLLNVLASVDQRDRQVRAIIAIDQPLKETKEQPPVLINDFVSVELKGRVFADHYRIPRRWLVDQQTVWVVNQDRLYQRQLTLSYIGRDFAWAKSGFESGDQLLVSQLDARLEGMPVRTRIPPSESDSQLPSELTDESSSNSSVAPVLDATIIKTSSQATSALVM